MGLKNSVRTAGFFWLGIGNSIEALVNTVMTETDGSDSSKTISKTSKETRHTIIHTYLNMFLDLNRTRMLYLAHLNNIVRLCEAALQNHPQTTGTKPKLSVRRGDENNNHRSVSLTLWFL
jgi:hypothetical protein